MATTPINNGSTLGSLAATKTSQKGQASGIGNSEKSQQVDQPAAQHQAAGVNISVQARRRAEDAKKAFEIAKNTPDIREDKVAKLKEQIAAGTYKVDAGNIADGILNEAIKDHLATSPDE